MTDRTGADSRTSESSAALTAWLASLVHNNDYASLAELRRPPVSSASPPTSGPVVQPDGGTARNLRTGRLPVRGLPPGGVRSPPITGTAVSAKRPGVSAAEPYADPTIPARPVSWTASCPVAVFRGAICNMPSHGCAPATGIRRPGHGSWTTSASGTTARPASRTSGARPFTCRPPGPLLRLPPPTLRRTPTHDQQRRILRQPVPLPAPSGNAGGRPARARRERGGAQIHRVRRLRTPHDHEPGPA